MSKKPAPEQALERLIEQLGALGHSEAEIRHALDVLEQDVAARLERRRAEEFAADMARLFDEGALANVDGPTGFVALDATGRVVRRGDQPIGVVREIDDGGAWVELDMVPRLPPPLCECGRQELELLLPETSHVPSPHWVCKPLCEGGCGAMYEGDVYPAELAEQLEQLEQLGRTRRDDLDIRIRYWPNTIQWGPMIIDVDDV